MMLKWKRVGGLVLLAAIILGMSSVFVYLSIRRATPSETENAGFFPRDPIAGEEVSFDQAQASVPFKIKLPAKMGSFVQVRLDNHTHFVAIIYAADKPADNATILDVINKNGIILIEEPYSGTLQEAESGCRAAIDATKNDPGGGLQPVTINGYFGCAGGNVGHCVDWCTEMTSYRLMVSMNYPLQQLVEIAQSIPVN